MRNFIAFFTRQTVFGHFLYLLVFLGGWIAIKSMPIDRFPNVDMDKAVVTTFYYGASPDEVERKVTRKIEEVIEPMDEVEYIQSKSYRNRSVVTVKFLDDTNMDKLYDDLRIRVLSIASELPERADEPVFTKVEVDMWLPVVQVNVQGDRSNRAMTLLSKELKTDLESIHGVRDVNLRGEYEREFHLKISDEKLHQYGISFLEVLEKLEKANVNIPSGSLKTDYGEVAISLDDRFRTSQDVLNVILRKDDDNFLRVSDIATGAFFSHRDQDVIVTINGQEVIALVVLKSAWADAISILKDVKDKIAVFEKAHAEDGINISLTVDSTKVIHESLNVLTSNLVTGSLFVFVVLVLCLGTFNAILACIGIPFSFFATLIAMKIAGSSINELSLFSFVMVSGVLVDDAIVVIENIDRHIKMGKSLFDACVDGTEEVFFPVLNSTLTNIASFLPMYLMTGSTGDFFSIIPTVVFFTMVSSLIECFMVLPMHVYDLGRFRKLREDYKDPRWLETVKFYYVKILSIFFDNPWKVVIGVGSAFIMALVILIPSLMGKAQFIRFKFFPDDPTQFMVKLKMPPNTPIEKTAQISTEISKYILTFGSKIQSVTSLGGMDFSDDYEEIYGHHIAMILGEFAGKRATEWKIDGKAYTAASYIDWMREKLKVFETRYPVKLDVTLVKDGPPTGKPINIRVMGNNYATVEALSERLENYLKSLYEKAVQLKNNPKAEIELDPMFKNFWGLTQITSNKSGFIDLAVFRPRKEALALYGLDPLEAVTLATGSMKGVYLSKFVDNDDEIDFLVKIDHSKARDIREALNTPLINHPSGTVRLGEVVDIIMQKEPIYLNRFQSNSSINVTADLTLESGLSANVVVTEMDRFYRSIQHEYPGAVINFTGEQESTQKSYRSLGLAFIIALVLIYGLLAIEFKSYTLPMLIMSTIVFAFTGVVYGAFIFRQLFTINSFIALVGLTGIVVNDSIVLLEFINRLIEQGVPLRQAIIDGSTKRVLPIFLISFTTIVGLLPMAIGFPYKSLVWGSMSMVFVTGMSFSTSLTLLVVPIEYELFCKIRTFFKRGKHGH